jgi:UDP-3-O-[3-hydroxymyristoyl] glucosamine N-acyltransferase
MSHTVAELAQIVGGVVEGEPNRIISGLCRIEESRPDCLSFVYKPQYYSHLYNTNCACVLVSTEFTPESAVNTTLIRVENPNFAFNRLLEIFYPPKNHPTGIEKLSYISPGVQIGADVYIGAFTYIGEGAVIESGAKIYPNTFIGTHVIIGANTVIYPNVCIYDQTEIGADCIIHAGAVIGSDGFGYTQQQGVNVKIPQLGKVIIENNVEIGANVTIDRATLGATRIEKGVKLDNLVHIAHNSVIGAHTVIAAQSGVSGSTQIGKNCMIGGQVGIVGHIQIADQTQVGAQSGISKSVVDKGSILRGSPAMPLREQLKLEALQRQLPYILDRLAALESRLDELSNKNNS